MLTDSYETSPRLVIDVAVQRLIHGTGLRHGDTSLGSLDREGRSTAGTYDLHGRVSYLQELQQLNDQQSILVIVFSTRSCGYIKLLNLTRARRTKQCCLSIRLGNTVYYARLYSIMDLQPYG
jgi:hypothetical protein